MPTSPEELHHQAQHIARQIKATAPEHVGFAILFYNKGGDSPVGFASSAMTEREKEEAVRLIRDFANHLSPSKIVLPT